MRIVVLVKEVPDTYGDRELDLETGLVDRGAGDMVLDEISERALEVALAHADAHPGAEVTTLTMASQKAVTSVRKALAMGAASAVHVADERLRGADLGLTAEVLAATIARGPFDLVIAGNQSTDGAGGVLPTMIAERLGVASLTSLVSVELTETSVRGARRTDTGTATVSAALPAVISITEALPDARFPNFKGIMAAKKKPLEEVSLDSLGIDAERVDTPRAIMLAVAERPPPAGCVKNTDEGDAGAQLATFLMKNQLA